MRDKLPELLKEEQIDTKNSSTNLSREDLLELYKELCQSKKQPDTIPLGTIPQLIIEDNRKATVDDAEMPRNRLQNPTDTPAHASEQERTHGNGLRSQWRVIIGGTGILNNAKADEYKHYPNIVRPSILRNYASGGTVWYRDTAVHP
ncbi:MAG: hypothetical protein K2W95_23715 [Candidatus Obscuribacterales bacterium]|nr:hypothetical protein [Candidatus Obscuribacterales bacterium]